MELPTIQINPTRTAIEWVKVLTEDNAKPLKFNTKHEAKAWANQHRITYDSIVRVQFRFNEAWVLFLDGKFLDVEKGEYRQCQNQLLGYRKTTIWDAHTTTYAYFWDKEKAIASIPNDSRNQISQTVFDNKGNIAFGRKFLNQSCS